MSLIQTLRKPRISVFDMKIAVFDLSLTLIGGYVIGKQLGYNPWVCSVSMIPLGIVVHDMMGIETEISKKITK
jgi:hypothetical protein